MWFNQLGQIAQIARNVGFCIFELPAGQNYAEILAQSVHIRRLDKDPGTGKPATVIKKAQIQEIFPLVDIKHQEDFFVVIEEAEKVGHEAYNCFLKHLEEPHEHVHYILLTRDLNQIIPTVRSRAQIFRQREANQLDQAPAYDAKTVELAKEYLSCSPAQLPNFVKKLTKNSQSAREKSQQLIEASIELMYRSYFQTGNPKFLHKLEKLLQTREQLTKGNLKLQLVAHML